MCACDSTFTCSKCAAIDRDELVRPLTLAEWDYLILCEQNVTAEPYEGRA